MEGVTSDLIIEASQDNRWMENIRQSPYLNSAASHTTTGSLNRFRELLAKTSEIVIADFAKYLDELHRLKKQAEIQLTTCSTFRDNCSRFIEWLDDCETKWAIPGIDEEDNIVIDHDMFLWEKQALASSCKVSHRFLFTVLIHGCFQV